MQIDLSAPIEAETVSSEVASTSTAVAVRQSQAPAVYTQSESAEGEFDAGDMEKARLTIVAATGKLAAEFTPGDMLVNGEYVIGDKKSPLIVVPVAIRKLYQNDLDFDGGEMGDTVKTAVEVAERGGIVGYRPYLEKDATHYWKKVAQIVFAIQKPKNVTPAAEGLFLFDANGESYALASYWASSKTAYSGVAVPLVMAFQAKKTVRLSTYSLSTKGMSTADGKRSWIQATLRATGATPTDVLSMLTEIAG
jgi:glucose dehydrogenase